jgi:hypothetical protein
MGLKEVIASWGSIRHATPVEGILFYFDWGAREGGPFPRFNFPPRTSDSRLGGRGPLFKFPPLTSFSRYPPPPPSSFLNINWTLWFPRKLPSRKIEWMDFGINSPPLPEYKLPVVSGRIIKCIGFRLLEIHIHMGIRIKCSISLSDKKKFPCARLVAFFYLYSMYPNPI